MGAGALGAGWDCAARRVDADVVVVVFVSVLLTGVNKGSQRISSFHCFRSFCPPGSCFSHLLVTFIHHCRWVCDISMWLSLPRLLPVGGVKLATLATRLCDCTCGKKVVCCYEMRIRSRGRKAELSLPRLRLDGEAPVQKIPTVHKRYC